MTPPMTWKLVPVEITKKMIDAGCHAALKKYGTRIGLGAAIASYRAMLAAAPEPPASPSPPAEAGEVERALQKVDQAKPFLVHAPGRGDMEDSGYSKIQLTHAERHAVLRLAAERDALAARVRELEGERDELRKQFMRGY